MKKVIRKLASFFFLLLLVFQVSSAQDQIMQTWEKSTYLSDASWQKMQSHPRLFANAKKWADLKKQIKSDSTSRHLFELVKQRAENTLNSPSLVVEGVGIFHGEARQIQGRIATLAMTYKLTDDKRFLDRARKEMKELANAINWRPDHFLSCSESTVAMSIGLDWLYNDLTQAERKFFAEAIIDKSLKVSLQKKYNTGNWSESDGNWGAVCNGGLAIGAIAVKEFAPELARNIKSHQ